MREQPRTPWAPAKVIHACLSAAKIILPVVVSKIVMAVVTLVKRLLPVRMRKMRIRVAPIIRASPRTTQTGSHARGNACRHRSGRSPWLAVLIRVDAPSRMNGMRRFDGKDLDAGSVVVEIMLRKKLRQVRMDRPLRRRATGLGNHFQLGGFHRGRTAAGLVLDASVRVEVRTAVDHFWPACEAPPRAALADSRRS